MKTIIQFAIRAKILYEACAEAQGRSQVLIVALVDLGLLRPFTTEDYYIKCYIQSKLRRCDEVSLRWSV